VTPKAIQDSEKFVHLSEHVLTESEEYVHKRGLNFAVTSRVSYLDMYVRLICKAQTSPRLGYGALLEESRYVGKIKTFDI
jgi:hypothetical protein